MITATPTRRQPMTETSHIACSALGPTIRFRGPIAAMMAIAIRARNRISERPPLASCVKSQGLRLSGASFAWLIINTSGYDFRKGQPRHSRPAQWQARRARVSYRIAGSRLGSTRWGRPDGRSPTTLTPATSPPSRPTRIVATTATTSTTERK